MIDKKLDGAWFDEIYAPIGTNLLVLCDNGRGKRYTAIAQLNDCGEWVDIPHLHSVLGWKPLIESEVAK